MILFSRVLTRPFGAIASALLVIAAIAIAKPAKAQEEGECEAASIIRIEHAGAKKTGDGKFDHYGYRTAICMSPDHSHLVYGGDFDIDKLPTDQIPLPAPVRVYLAKMKGDLAVAQEKADMDAIRAHIWKNSPVTAALRTDLPIIDEATGKRLESNLIPPPPLVLASYTKTHAVAVARASETHPVSKKFTQTAHRIIGRKPVYSHAGHPAKLLTARLRTHRILASKKLHPVKRVAHAKPMRPAHHYGSTGATGSKKAAFI